MKKIVFPILMSVLLLLIIGCTKKPVKQDSYTIVFYNVENLFDTINDPVKDDEYFLPDSRIDWNTEKYLRKLDMLSEVISAIDNNHFPSLVGLAEIENKLVLNDLIRTQRLKKASYEIIHEESPDERGIDVALLYRKEHFSPLYSSNLAVTFPFDPANKTRDILYVKGRFLNDTIHIFINHWPSRRGGQEQSEPYRIQAARTLRETIDSLIRTDQNPMIIAMGDFNDEPADTSVLWVLGANKRDQLFRKDKLYNLMFEKYEQDEGTLYWNGWNIYDQFIVSGILMDHLDRNNELIFKKEWLLYEMKDGTKIPNRTAGSSYYGGYSDHLPVYIRINKQ